MPFCGRAQTGNESHMKGLYRALGRDAVDLGASLAQELSRRYPLTLEGKAGMPKVSVDRLSRILEGIYTMGQALQREHRFGWFRKARLCHAFKWKLHELGYSKPFIDKATEGLVIYLCKADTQPSPTKVRTSGNNTGAK